MGVEKRKTHMESMREQEREDMCVSFAHPCSCSHLGPFFPSCWPPFCWSPFFSGCLSPFFARFLSS